MLTISPLYFAAISKASLDFPAPVDPKITTTGNFLTEAAMILNILDWLHGSVLLVLRTRLLIQSSSNTAPPGIVYQCPAFSICLTVRFVLVHFYYHFLRILNIYPVADLRGGVRDARPPSASKFFQFHAVFGRIRQNCVFTPPPWRVHAPPPWGNPGSVTAICIGSSPKGQFIHKTFLVWECRYNV